MAEPLNTNNSLTDLNNEEFLFNDYLTDDNKKALVESRETEKRKKDEIEALRRKRSEAKNENERVGIEAEITTKQQELDNFRKDNLSSNTNDASSLFNRTAYIDYAKIYNAKKDWIHYNSEGDGVFGLNNGAAINKVVDGDGKLPADEGLSPRHLIQWSEQYPALQLRSQDFAYCKNLGVYPNNRLIVLRRFRNGIPDNLFDYYSESSLNSIEHLQPISTLINWVKPEQKFVDIKFNENWEKHAGSFLDSLAGGVKDKIGNVIGSSLGGVVVNGVVSLLLDSLGNEKGEKFKRSDGTKYLDQSFEGNANLINTAKKRKTGADGLSSNIHFDLTFEYEMRYINKIDPGVAILDLMSNCIRMGTSTSYFRFDIPKIKNSEIIKKAITGDFTVSFEKIEKELKEFITGIGIQFTKFTNNKPDSSGENPNSNTQSSTENTVETALKYTISRYREELKASLAAETGLPSGIWHVTIGNPKNPIVSCGDLILSRSELNLGKELGYNDFPNEFSVTYSLESARERGRDEIERIFNAGRGRVYTYSKPSNNSDYNIYDPIKGEIKKNN